MLLEPRFLVGWALGHKDADSSPSWKMEEGRRVANDQELQIAGEK